MATPTGFYQHRTGMWEWTADNCDCDYCTSWISTTITECVYDNALHGTCTIKHDGITNTITVESWSGVK